VTRALAAYREIAVVLGAGLRRDGTPNPSTLARADAAASLKDRPGLAYIVSGSHGNGPRPAKTEAAFMAERLAQHGVDPARIFLEDESRDTLSNAAFVAERYLKDLEPRPLVIVTSPFHLARSVATFRLVLGPAWPLSGHAAAPGPNDDAHAANEDLFLARTRARLEGLAPGDVARIARHVRDTLAAFVSDDPPA